MEFDNNIPIYQQVMDVVKTRIVSGRLECGERIKSVRELALEMGVNPNTMQKALAALETEGLIITERTSGKYVTNDQEAIDNVKRDMIRKAAAAFLHELERLGVDRAEVFSIITACLKTP